jgi:hypothetical protein
MLLNLKGVPADGLPGPLRGGGGGRPPVLFLAVPVFDFLAGVGGSEESVPGAFRFPELEAFCAVCAMLVRFGCSDFYGIVLDSSCANSGKKAKGDNEKDTVQPLYPNKEIMIKERVGVAKVGKQTRELAIQ